MRPGPVRSAAGSALVLAVAVLAQLPTHDRSLVAIDEGQLAAIADRIGRGQVLYRDVYTGIFPGVYHLAAWLLAPYLAWVAFAAVLNFAIVRLNGPFG